MRFQVPQFIEVEDKVVGPFTFRQFIYLVGGGGLSFVLYVYLPKLAAFPLIAIVVALSLALAFYKVNNKPFIFLLESFLRYTIGRKLYVWRKTEKKPTAAARGGAPAAGVYVPKLSDSKLRDLSWSLDVTESGEEQVQ